MRRWLMLDGLMSWNNVLNIGFSLSCLRNLPMNAVSCPCPTALPSNTRYLSFAAFLSPLLTGADGRRAEDFGSSSLTYRARNQTPLVIECVSEFSRDAQKYFRAVRALASLSRPNISAVSAFCRVISWLVCLSV